MAERSSDAAGTGAQMSPAAGALGPLGPAVSAARDQLSREIADGSLAPGQRLGAERELAQRLGVSRTTVRAALEDLERGGAITRLRGRSGGIFVAPRKVERDLTTLAGLPAYLRQQGFESDARVIATATFAAGGTLATALGCAAGELVHEITRVRLADGSPISLERANFPAKRFPGLLDNSLSGSLYELLSSRYGLILGESEERIEVVGAGTSASQVLELPRQAPLVSISRTAWDVEGIPFEFSRDLFRGDRVRIVVRARTLPGGSDPLAAAVEVMAGDAR